MPYVNGVYVPIKNDTPGKPILQPGNASGAPSSSTWGPGPAAPARPAMPSFGGGAAGPSSPFVTQGISGAGTTYAAAPAAKTAGAGAVGGGAGQTLTNSMQISPQGNSMMAEYLARLKKQGMAPPDPNLQTQVNRLGQRLSTDTTQRAIDRSSSNIADAAAGQKSAMGTTLARRGVSGVGVGDQRLGMIDSAAQRAKAGASADISLGRERDLDALVLGGQGIMAAPGQSQFQREQAGNASYLGGLGAQGDLERNALAQGKLGLDAYTQGRSLDLQERGQNLGAQDQQMAQYLALLRMYS